MRKCKKCGAEVEDELKVCPACNAEMEEEKSEKASAEQDTAEKLKAKLNSLNDTKDSTQDFDEDDVKNNKIMAIFSYFSYLVLIPIFAAPKSKFARFHANQGLVLTIVETAWWIIEAIIVNVCFAIAAPLGAILSVILGIVNIVFVIMLILGVKNVLEGKAKELPVIGKYKILK